MIIAFTGKAGSGKTTAAYMVNYILNNINYEDYKNRWGVDELTINIHLYNALFMLRRIETSKYPVEYKYKSAKRNAEKNGSIFFEPRGFADKLKLAASVITELPLDDFYDTNIKNTVMPIYGGRFTYRSFLQKLATEACRDNLYDNIWVDGLLGNYSGLENLVIYDLRFDNEAKRVKELGGIIIKLENNSIGVESNHISEQGITLSYNIDYTIQNNGTLEDLYNNIKQVLKQSNLFEL